MNHKIKQRWTLNKAGCVEAGQWLRAKGIPIWAYSSSADFPCETKPTFRGDVRDFVERGYTGKN
jgi:hypothetical protein